VNPRVRLPKNYNNFVGLIEQLFEVGQVPPKGEPLLSMEDGGLDELLAKLRPDYVVGLTTEGRLLSFGELASKLLSFERPAVLVGGFQRGHFSEGTMSLANEAVSVGKFHFMASVVIARLIYEFELKTGVYEKIVQE
jgi:rRNA small subunit pseudouridine methyltransferase Nep1